MHILYIFVCVCTSYTRTRTRNGMNELPENSLSETLETVQYFSQSNQTQTHETHARMLKNNM